MNRRSLLWLPAVLIFGFASAAFAVRKDGRLDIYWVDVEGGAATLIVTPTGEAVLIDAGNPGRRDPERIFRVATEQAGLTQIDHLITTHYHRDHYGGAADLSQLIPIKNLYDNGKFEGMPDNPGAAYWNFKCKKRHVISPGDTLPLRQLNSGDAPALSLTCLVARKTFIKPQPGMKANAQACEAFKPKNRDGSDNANSVVTLLAFGPFRFYDGGDLTWNQEQKLVCPINLVGKVDVYQIAHHGLDSSNNPVLLNTLNPSVVIMNNGSTKGCMPEVFGNISSLASLKAMYQVHKNVRPDGRDNNVPDEYIANKEVDCQGHFIKLSVAPSGKEYTVSLPAHGHTRTFATK